MYLGFLVGVSLLLFLMLALFFIASKLFALLRRDHPALYSALDEPQVLMRNGTRHQWLLVKYLFTRQWRDINDKRLNAYSYAMLAIYILYLLLIVTVAIIVVSQ